MRAEGAAASSERNAAEGPASRRGGDQTRRLDRLTLGHRQECRTLRLRCDLPPSTSGSARVTAVDRLSTALGTWTRQFDAHQEGAVTLRREVGVRKGRMTASIVVQHAAAWAAIGDQICDGLLPLPPPFNGAVAASWEDDRSEIHVRVVGVPPFMSPEQMRDVLQRQGVPPRVCQHEPGRHGLRRNEAFLVIFPPETKRPLPKGVELTDVGAKLRYDVIPGVRIPQLPPDPEEEQPERPDPGEDVPGAEVPPQDVDVSQDGCLAPVPETAAPQQSPGPVYEPPAAMPLVCAGDVQPQPALSPHAGEGPATLSLVSSGQPVQRRPPVSAASRRGRSEVSVNTVAVRRSTRISRWKRLRAASEGSPSDGSEGSEDRNMSPSNPPSPSGQG